MGGQAPRKGKHTGAGKGKHTVVLTAEAHQRLGVEALMTRRDRSDVVNALILAHCRRYVVQDRGARGDDPGGESSAPAGEGGRKAG